MGYNGFDESSEHVGMRVDIYGNASVLTNYYPSWSLTKYYTDEYQTPIELKWTYLSGYQYRKGSRLTPITVQRWGWKGSDENGVHYFLTSTEEDQWARDWTNGKLHRWITSSGTIKDITLSSDKLSIETIDGESNQITCTRTSKDIALSTNPLAFTDQIPSSVSQLTNDAGYITASAIPPIPSNTSDLVNDSGFITSSAIPSNVGAFTNDVGYVTAATVAASYYNKTEIDGMIGSINTILDNINGEVI